MLTKIFFVICANSQVDKLNAKKYLVRFYQDGLFGASPGGYVEVPMGLENIKNDSLEDVVLELNLKPQKKRKS